MHAPLDLERYRTILSAFYGFYVPWEQGLDHWSRLAFGDEGSRRAAKTAKLRSDLQALGIDHRGLSLCSYVPESENLSAALGSFYVMEGATLGGQVICRKVRQDLPQTADQACAFFNGYGDQTGPMWREFQAVALAKVADDAAAVASAGATFRAFASWVAECGL